MNPWDLIGWAIAVPLIAFSALLVYAVSVAVVRAIASRMKQHQSATVTKDRHLRAVD